MIHTDREIQTALHASQIAIVPSPAADAYSSTSVDLTLGAQIRVWNAAGTDPGPIVIAPASEGYNYLDIAEAHTASDLCLGGGDDRACSSWEQLRQ